MEGALVEKGSVSKEGSVQRLTLTWGANWSAVETVRAVSGVTMGLAAR